MIKEHYNEYYPEKLDFLPLQNSSELDGVFLIKIGRDSVKCGKTLLDIPNMLNIHCDVFRFPEANSTLDGYRRSECYSIYTDKDGLSPYIEATLSLLQENGEVRTVPLGIPLNLFATLPEYFYLLYDGVNFAWICNGRIINRDYPLGTLQKSTAKYIDGCICFSPDFSALSFKEKAETLNKSISFYSPPEFNAWAGDTATFSHGGVYHLLILYDRHHHGSRFGHGAHSVIHLTTRDFISWENHGEIYSLKSQWETFGTGTAFYYGGKYYYCHGFHTSRVMPYGKTGSYYLNKEYEKAGYYGAVDYEKLYSLALTPSGSNYLVSDDGINFTPARKQVHPSENPSIYPCNDRLIMYSGYGSSGVWSAPNIDGPWKKEISNAPIFEQSSPVGNSTECANVFSWNGYTYILMGFRGFWQSGYNSGDFTDLAVKGEDIYDGLCVPSVTEFNGRYILCGWLNGYGWGYVIQFRELIQKDNGKLKIRWMKELTPDTSRLLSIFSLKSLKSNAEISVESNSSYYLECTVHPAKNAKVALTLSGSGTPCTFELNTLKNKVQISENKFADILPDEIKSLHEYIENHLDEEKPYLRIPPDKIHSSSYDFAIAKVSELEHTYKLKIIFRYEKKTDSLILDAEIGESRTFISNRANFKAEKIKFLCQNAEIKDPNLYKL